MLRDCERTIIIRWQFIKCRKWPKGALIFDDDGQRVQYAGPELPAPHYICTYRLIPTTPPSPARHYYPRLIAGTNLPTAKGWTAWRARAQSTYITFCPRFLHNWIQMHEKEVNPGEQGQDQLNRKGTWTQIVGPKTNSVPTNWTRRRAQRLEKLFSTS